MARLWLGCLLWVLLPAAQADERYAIEKHPDIDLSGFTCSQFLDGIENRADNAKMHDLVMWLEGYLGGISGNTTLRWQDLLDYKKDLLSFCDKNPTLGLLEAARRAAVE